MEYDEERSNPYDERNDDDENIVEGTEHLWVGGDDDEGMPRRL